MHGPPHDCKGKQKGVDCTDGSTPYASPVQASDVNLYGTTYDGGANYKSCSGGCGTIFTITTAGTLTTLYNFCSQPECADGSPPEGGLVQDTSGSFFTVRPTTAGLWATARYTFCP